MLLSRTLLTVILREENITGVIFKISKAGQWGRAVPLLGGSLIPVKLGAYEW